MLEFVVTMVQVKTFVDRKNNTSREYYKVWFALPSSGKQSGYAWLFSNFCPTIGSKIKVGFRAASSANYDGQAQLYIIE